MSDSVKTWHYGLMAQHWAERNTTGPEIAYFQQQIERYGQPALDAGCGTGRLLIPFLHAGLDVDGCDVSADWAAWEIRASYPAWDAWIAAAARQKAQECALAVSGGGRG